MATIKRLFVFATSILSGIATLFLIISLSTEQWIVCKRAEYLQVFHGYASVQYGLFQGTFQTDWPAPRILVLSSKYETFIEQEFNKNIQINLIKNIMMFNL